jgi:transmembrane sensor
MLSQSGNHWPVRPEEAAAAWFARHRVAPLSEQDATAFRSWLTHSPDNARAWNSLERLWARLDTVSDVPTVLALREAAGVRAGQYRLGRRVLQWGSALAASTVVCLYLWQWPTPGVVRVESSSALVLPVSPQASALPLVRVVSTRIGQRALVELADGSKVTLNSDSLIQADYTGNERNISLLRGEAYFEVAKNKTRPFIVTAGSRQVIALGTAFNVRLQPRQLNVDLVEGKVRVVHLVRGGESNRAPGSAVDQVTLEAGSSLVARRDELDRIEPLNSDRELSWRTGKLVFNGNRLADVVAEMNRYSTDEIALRDRTLDDRLVSGVFNASGGVEFARALESYGLVSIAARTGTTIELTEPKVAAE